MTDRRAELEALAEEVADREAIADAFVAKSFSDQLVIVDVAAEADGSSEATEAGGSGEATEAGGSGEAAVPTEVRECLASADVLPVEQVYGDEENAGSPVGPIEEGTRHHFVDVRTRGTHRTEVVE